MSKSELEEVYQSHLFRAAIDYLDTGMMLFKKHRQSQTYTGYQAAIGNLAISIELMLKAFIAGRDINMVFKNLPLETKAFINCPDYLPDAFNSRALDLELRSAPHQMLELDECISLFYVFYPETKQILQPHLRFVSKVRNQSVHSFLPKYYRYELERTAFTALSIYKVLQSSTFPNSHFSITHTIDLKFLDEFQATKLERIQKKVESVKEQAKKSGIVPSKLISTTLSHWDHEIILCPFCNSEAFLYGTTELVHGEPCEDGQIPSPLLLFYADSFECFNCGFTLDDSDELRFVDIKETFDRSDEMEIYLQEVRRKRLRRYVALGLI